jgi:hypothetical protein
MISPCALYCEQLPRFTAVVVVARACVGFSDSGLGLGHWLAGLGPGGLLLEAGVSADKVGGAARTLLGLLYPRRLKKTYHAAGGGCRNRACQVRS